jgi:hypothetical protein
LAKLSAFGKPRTWVRTRSIHGDGIKPLPLQIITSAIMLLRNCRFKHDLCAIFATVRCYQWAMFHFMQIAHLQTYLPAIKGHISRTDPAESISSPVTWPVCLDCQQTTLIINVVSELRQFQRLRIHPPTPEFGEELWGIGTRSPFDCYAINGT